MHAEVRPADALNVHASILTDGDRQRMSFSELVDRLPTEAIREGPHVRAALPLVPARRAIC